MPDKRTKPAKALRGPPSPDFPIVAIGASAGGLDACTRLISALPARTGMAFILIQHLDPHHESMMADLLAGHTAMTVGQANDGDTITPDHPARELSFGQFRKTATFRTQCQAWCAVAV